MDCLNNMATVSEVSIKTECNEDNVTSVRDPLLNTEEKTSPGSVSSKASRSSDFLLYSDDSNLFNDNHPNNVNNSAKNNNPAVKRNISAVENNASEYSDLNKKLKLVDNLLEENKKEHDQRLKLMEKIYEKLDKKEPNDPVHTFFRSMADIVITFHPYLIARTRKKVCEVVSEMEMLGIEAKLASERERRDEEDDDE